MRLLQICNWHAAHLILARSGKFNGPSNTGLKLGTMPGTWPPSCGLVRGATLAAENSETSACARRPCFVTSDDKTIAALTRGSASKRAVDRKTEDPLQRKAYAVALCYAQKSSGESN